LLTSTPASPFQASCDGFASGLVGTIGVRIDQGASNILARTTAGIVEFPAGSGIYVATLTSPSIAGYYQITWDTGVVGPGTTAVEDLLVTSSVAAGGGFQGTFKKIQDNVILRLNLDAVADLQNVKDYINQAYSQVVVETEALQTSGSFTLTPGTKTYDLSTVLSNVIVRIKTISLTFGGQTFPPIQQVSIDKLLRLRIGAGGSSPASGTVTHYAVNGLNDLEVYPTPQSADTMTVFYSYQPAALSADGDTPVIPEPYATRCLTAGALWQGSDITGDPAGGQYQADFEQWTGRFRAHLNRRRGGQPGAFEPYPAPAYPPHDPATILSGW
jgi:hypothetical protein